MIIFIEQTQNDVYIE